MFPSISRFVVMETGYDEALETCSNHGETLVQINSLVAAMDAFEQSELSSGLRIDAISNETCFKDQQGNEIDLSAYPFALDIPLPQQSLGIAVDESNGSLSPAYEGKVLTTVCQFPVQTDLIGGDTSSDVVTATPKDSITTPAPPPYLPTPKDGITTPPPTAYLPTPKSSITTPPPLWGPTPSSSSGQDSTTAPTPTMPPRSTAAPFPKQVFGPGQSPAMIYFNRTVSWQKKS